MADPGTSSWWGANSLIQLFLCYAKPHSQCLSDSISWTLGGKGKKRMEKKRQNWWVGVDFRQGGHAQVRYPAVPSLPTPAESSSGLGGTACWKETLCSLCEAGIYTESSNYNPETLKAQTQKSELTFFLCWHWIHVAREIFELCRMVRELAIFSHKTLISLYHCMVSEGTQTTTITAAGFNSLEET